MDIKMTITGITLIKAGIIMIMIGSQAGLTGILQRITTTIIHPSTPTTRHTITPNPCTTTCRSCIITRILIPGGEQTSTASAAPTTQAALTGPTRAALASEIRKKRQGQVILCG